ncbi:MAG TPA: TorF family putative porin [Candidatus Saccharimonadia bacterium]|nr:TorF family putative porin [Candidatus Saccharimonadia bacterium]
MRTMLAAAWLATGCAQASAQSVTAYAAIASDYVDRGVALGGGRPRLQAGAAAAFESGVVAGAFATTIDRLWTRDGGSARLEADAYVGYDFGCGGRCRARALVTRYVFPGQRDADWTEWSLALAPHPRFGASVGWSAHVYARPFGGRTLEAWYEHPCSDSVTLGVAAGRIRTRFFDYGYGRASATWRRDRVAIDVSWHVADEEYRSNGFTDDLRHVVGTVTWAF